MGEVINFSTPSTETAISAADERLSHDDVALLTTIRDDIETLLDMMANIRRDPAAVAQRLCALACCVWSIYMVSQQF